MLSSNPNFANAYLNLGNLISEQGNYSKALKYTLRCLELEPNNSDALLNLGGILKELGDPEQAIEQTHKSLK